MLATLRGSLSLPPPFAPWSDAAVDDGTGDYEDGYDNDNHGQPALATSAPAPVPAPIPSGANGDDLESCTADSTPQQTRCGRTVKKTAAAKHALSDIDTNSEPDGIPDGNRAKKKKKSRKHKADASATGEEREGAADGARQKKNAAPKKQPTNKSRQSPDMHSCDLCQYVDPRPDLLSHACMISRISHAYHHPNFTIVAILPTMGRSLIKVFLNFNFVFGVQNSC